MGKINWGRVLLGGLLAGVIINIFEYVTNEVILKAQWAAVMKTLGIQMAPHAIAMFIIWGFLLGIGAIWVYALARPRLGPGVKTAALTGLGYWIFAYALPNLGTWAMGLFPHHLLLLGSAIGLVELILASIAGAWLYKE